MAPTQGEGYVFLYSATYQYLTGRRFAQGRFLPGAARLAFQPHPGTAAGSGTKPAVAKEATTANKAPAVGAPCLDWYSGETGKYITTTGDCNGLGSGGSGDVPPVYTGGGGPCGGSCGGSTGPSGYGGGGGGGSSSTTIITATTVLVVPPDIPVTDIKQYLKCFNTNQPATLTVYTRQPTPGTSDTWSINGGVGHAFVSISQNGITRVFGFYPTSKAAIISDSPGVFGDNSQTTYTVSISKQVFGGDLYSLLQYTYTKANASYKLPLYNCTDFAIGAAAAAGLNLPDTWGQWGGVSGGSNPGNLGQDISTMPLPAGTQRGGSGISPANTGGC